MCLCFDIKLHITTNGQKVWMFFHPSIHLLLLIQGVGSGWLQAMQDSPDGPLFQQNTQRLLRGVWVVPRSNEMCDIHFLGYFAPPHTHTHTQPRCSGAYSVYCICAISTLQAKLLRQQITARLSRRGLISRTESLRYPTERTHRPHISRRSLKAFARFFFSSPLNSPFKGSCI